MVRVRLCLSVWFCGYLNPQESLSETIALQESKLQITSIKSQTNSKFKTD